MGRRSGFGPAFDLMLAMQKMWLDASLVIWRRSMMMGSGTMTAPEAMRMFSEKPLAMAEAMTRGSLALARGGDATGVARAAVRLLARKARSNERRLR